MACEASSSFPYSTFSPCPDLFSLFFFLCFENCPILEAGHQRNASLAELEIVTIRFFVASNFFGLNRLWIVFRRERLLTVHKDGSPTFVPGTVVSGQILRDRPGTICRLLL